MFTSNNEQQEETQGYLVVYSFEGTARRLNVGHAAIWDGSQYFTYGSRLKFGIPVDSAGLADAYADKDNEKCHFGKWRKLIIPVDATYLAERAKIQAEIKQEWKSYSLLNHNCAQMVEDYLVRAGVQSERQKTYITLRPGEVEKQTILLGREKMKAVIERQRSLQLTETQIDNRKNYLSNLQLYLSMCKSLQRNQISFGMIELSTLLNNQNIEDLSPANLNKLFCDVTQLLSEINYADTLDASNPAIQQFYTTWFSLAITPDTSLTQEKFENAERTLASIVDDMLAHLSNLEKLFESIAARFKHDKDREN